MATLAEFETARTAFVAAPSESTMRTMLGQRAGLLVDGTSGDGVASSLISLEELEAWAERTLARYLGTSAGGGPRIAIGRTAFGDGR